jgi:hypothetical protein
MSGSPAPDQWALVQFSLFSGTLIFQQFEHITAILESLPRLPDLSIELPDFRFPQELMGSLSQLAQAASWEDSPRQRFERLADEWHKETGHLSSPEDIALHPAYLRIIGMGPAAIPFILDDLRRRGGQWYLALRALTGTSPVTSEMSRSARSVKQAWLQWGEAEGY